VGHLVLVVRQEQGEQDRRVLLVLLVLQALPGQVVLALVGHQAPQVHRALVGQQVQVVQALRGLVDLRVLAVHQALQVLQDPRV